MVLPFGALSQVIAGTICGVMLTKIVVAMASLKKKNRNDSDNTARVIDIECKDDIMPRLGLRHVRLGTRLRYRWCS